MQIASFPTGEFENSVLAVCQNENGETYISQNGIELHISKFSKIAIPGIRAMRTLYKTFTRPSANEIRRLTQAITRDGFVIQNYMRAEPQDSQYPSQSITMEYKDDVTKIQIDIMVAGGMYFRVFTVFHNGIIVLYVVSDVPITRDQRKTRETRNIELTVNQIDSLHSSGNTLISNASLQEFANVLITQLEQNKK
ncbi:hypothetical protein [Microcystis phage Mel-JY01]